MRFAIGHLAKNSKARTGTLATAHGIIETPVFMPVASNGSVKSLPIWELEKLGATMILGNTYHLHLRPGEENIAQAGGLHKWLTWDKPILTDSGGYQAFSLGTTRAKIAKTNDDGVKFASHLDGRKLEFTPESVLDIQLKLGSDIVMVLDDCPPFPASEVRLRQAVSRTTDWAKRSLTHWQKQAVGERGVFGIIQGGGAQAPAAVGISTTNAVGSCLT